jgi:regulator of sigma E protease
MSGGAAIWLFVISLVAAIMIHEAGHFVTARWFGMRADRFFLGFGPTVWSTHRGETEYGVKALLLGGFVRIKGMSPIDERLRPLPEQIFEPSALEADRERDRDRRDRGPGHRPDR